MAAMSVGIGGQNKIWCINLRACCLVGIVYAFIAIWAVWLVVVLLGERAVGVPVGLIGRCHNFVCGSLGPSNTVSPWMVTLHNFLVNVTSHPLSQNCRVASNDVCDNCGTMWPVVISSGSHGMSRLQVCVDWILLPSGRVILMGFLATCLFVTGASSFRKCPVAPESEIPIAMVLGIIFCALL